MAVYNRNKKKAKSFQFIYSYNTGFDQRLLSSIKEIIYQLKENIKMEHVNISEKI